MFFYLNDDLVCQMNGVKEKKAYPIKENLRNHDSVSPFYIGFCKQMNTYYKGKIAEVKIFNKYFENVNDVFDNEEDLVLHYNFDSNEGSKNVNINEENIDIIENILPFRREGHMYCLPHADEGFLNGGWAKGETTARNEKRLVNEMQQKMIDYKNDGMNNLKYNLVSTEMFLDNCLMINVTL